MKIGFWDIENTPLTAYTWSLWPTVISIDQIRESAEIMSFAWKWRGKKGTKFYSTFHDGQEEMLEAAWHLLNEADAVVSWNGVRHDTPHIMREFLLRGWQPPSPYKEIDLMKAVKRRFKFASNKLDHVARELGLPLQKLRTDFDLWIQCMAGDEKAWNKMRRYNRRDVVLLEHAYDRLLPWIPNHPNVNLYDDAALAGERCPVCRSERYTREGYAYTQQGKFQRFHCTEEGCGKWWRGTKALARVEIREVAA